MANTVDSLIHNNGPTLWGKIIEYLETPHAVISGGAVRDYHLGLPAKDIDIFLPNTSVGELDDLCEFYSREDDVTLALQPGCGSYMGADDPLVAVAEGDIAGVPVNLLLNERLKTSVQHLIEGHDFGICQAAWYRVDGKPEQPKVATTQAFAKDLEDRTATITTLRSYERSLRRFDKFTARHGTEVLTLVDPYQYKLKLL